MTRAPLLTAIVLLCAIPLSAGLATAEEASEHAPPVDAVPVAADTDIDETEQAERPCERDGLHVCSTNAIALRGTPLGLNLISDLSLRLPLFEGSESALFQGTYVEAGPTIGISPAYFWGGAFIQALPVAVLQIRGSIQYVNYWGYNQYNVAIEDPQTGWSLEDLNNAEQRDRITMDGLMVRAQFTPRYRSGRIVVTMETDIVHIAMNEFERDRNAPPGAFDPEFYHEPYHDIVLEPSDTIIWFKPTVGYLIGSDLSNAFLLLAGRYDHMTTSNSEVTRSIAGLVYLWQIPRHWGLAGQPQLSGFAGAFVNHPSREIAPYFGTQYIMRF